MKSMKNFDVDINHPDDLNLIEMLIKYIIIKFQGIKTQKKKQRDSFATRKIIIIIKRKYSIPGFVSIIASHLLFFVI